MRQPCTSRSRWNAKVSDIMENGRWNPTNGRVSMQEIWDNIPSYSPNAAVEDKKGHIPRHAFMLWLATKQRLSTMDRLPASIGLIDKTCTLCREEDEDHRHLFFRFTKRVWESINEKTDLHWPLVEWNHLVQWAASNIHRKNTMSMIARLIMAASVYYIWQERNRRVFRMQMQNSHYIVNEIYQLIRAHLSCMATIPDSVKL
ncbi:hypothetical protein OIU74_015454 [Salix koriyanagi]|uniref:Reverse transcriptase zinc-binding domain-containing protein n=1 Tax=Salix koriyanagi TaxID=2511006 RepID=A0A9Q0NH30_9ROSI|nr:hypothetical protein OIU74_015454 [Salix koriyanagi]